MGGTLAFSADGKALAYTSGSQVILIDPQTRRQIRAFPGSGSTLHSLTFSPDNRRIAVAAQDQVMVWETVTGRTLFSFTASTYEERMYHLGPILAFSSDGKLAAADMNGISIRDALTGRELLSLPGHSGRVVCLAFSPDGKRLASGSTSDMDAKLWDTTTGEEMLAFRGHTNSIQSVAFSPDGDCLASSSVDCTVRL
jgi:WD40 repeat protein